MTDPVAEALVAHPELAHLLTLDSQWRWMPPPRDESTGDILELHGIRVWPQSDQVDAIRVRTATDAMGMRVDADSGVLWQLEDGLIAVVNGLRELPPPGDRLAPQLVKGRTESGLWIA